jgi:SAM-dependent methyltransferase
LSSAGRIRDRAAGIRRRLRYGLRTPLETLEPPAVLAHGISGGDFATVGPEFAGYLVRLGGLRPTDRVLDVGCGAGRVALPLMNYLDGGSYEGMDVHPEAVNWCRQNLTARDSSFRFQAVPVRSEWFNPWGSEEPERFEFPFDDGEFDFAFGVSLFTHLLRPGTERYLAEIARVLKPSGRWLLTFFLIPPDGPPEPSPEWPAPPGWAGPASFQHRVDGCRLLDPDHPDRGIAHEEVWLLPAVASAGLSVRAVHRGFWPGRHGLSFQDIVIGERTGD